MEIQGKKQENWWRGWDGKEVRSNVTMVVPWSTLECHAPYLMVAARKFAEIYDKDLKFMGFTFKNCFLPKKFSLFSKMCTGPSVEIYVHWMDTIIFAHCAQKLVRTKCYH